MESSHSDLQHDDVKMFSDAEEFVRRRRADIVLALCSSGSSEHLESVLDVLLSRELLTWEEHLDVLVPGRPLHASARRLLDLVCCKGAETCAHLMTALKLVLPESRLGKGIEGGIISEEREDEGMPTRSLVTQRARLVGELRDALGGLLDALVSAGYFTAADLDAVKLPVKTPSQQVRALLDHVRSKGDPAAELVLRYAQQQRKSTALQNEREPSVPEEVSRYQKKLSSFVMAQSSFVDTYGGDSVMCLDDIYTEGQLELPQDKSETGPGHLSLEDIVGVVGTRNTEADTVLLSGDAGSGKSTLLQRMHLLWARGTALQEFILLFPFSCRMFNSEQKEVSVVDLLFRRCCWPDRDKEEIFQFILDHPHLVVFTFDGLDELKDPFSDEHRLCCPTQSAPISVVLFNLLQGCLMKGVRKVVSGRPQAGTPTLKKYLRKEVILKGFSPSNIVSFVRKHHNNPTVAEKVLESLKTNRALLGLCHSPVLCWIISHCHRKILESQEESPKTITHAYLMILQHLFQRQSSTASRSDDSSWIQHHHKSILHLGQLAFEGINCSVYIFTRAELDRCRVRETEVRSGFLIHSKNMSSNHIKTFEFLHVTIQCFFAAAFLVLSTNIEPSTVPGLFQSPDSKMTPLGHTCFNACLSSSVQQQRIRDDINTEAKHHNLQITAMFLCGLLSQRHQRLWSQCCSTGNIEKRTKQVAKYLSKALYTHFKSIPQPVQGEKKSMHAMPDFVWLIKCIYEMQENAVAKDAMSKMDVQHLKLVYCSIGPVECTALAFVLQHLKNPVGLQLDFNYVGDVGVEQLLPCLHMCRSLYLRNNNISDEGICKVIMKGILCENFQKIALFNNNLTDKSMKDFSELLKRKTNFLSLRLGNNNISAEGATQLAEGLGQNQSLQYLGLWGNKIGDAGARALACALENSSSLVWLSLVGNSVGSAGAFALAKVIKNCRSLEELWLTDNCISLSGAESLTEALQQNPRMKSVWLRNNHLSENDKEQLSQQEPRLLF